MAEKMKEERPKTQAEKDYNEHYSSASNYYGGPSRPDPNAVSDRKYDDQEPPVPVRPDEQDASYDKQRYTDEELSRLNDETHGNDEWFASGAGVQNEPFERRWTGARSSTSTASQRPASGMLRSSHASDRRVFTRRDIGHDPFIERFGADERRTQISDRRSNAASKSRKGPSAHPR